MTLEEAAANIGRAVDVDHLPMQGVIQRGRIVQVDWDRELVSVQLTGGFVSWPIYEYAPSRVRLPDHE